MEGIQKMPRLQTQGSQDVKPQYEELEVGDPFEFFLKQAYTLGPRLQLPMDFTHEAVAIVRGAFGDEWLRAQTKGPKNIHVLMVIKHPLGEYFSLPGPSTISSVFELAVYLKRLAGIPGLEEVVRDMKVTDRYSTGMLQLAYAYRFLRCGMMGLVLEPPASSGRKADIHFELDGRSYLVECYTPRQKVPDTSCELYYSFERIAEEIKRVPSRVCVRLTRPITALDRRRIERLAVEAIRQAGESGAAEFKDDAADVSIEKVTAADIDADFAPDRWFRRPPLPGHPDWGWVSRLVARSDLGLLRDAAESVKRGAARVGFLVWQAPQEKQEIPLEERIATLEKKIGRKTPQTRGERDAGRVLIVSIPEAWESNSEAIGLIQELHRRLIGSHPEIAAIFVTSRRWTDIHRHKFALYLLDGQEQRRLPPAVFGLLRAAEEEDLFVNWR